MFNDKRDKTIPHRNYVTLKTHLRIEDTNSLILTLSVHAVRRIAKRSLVTGHAGTRKIVSRLHVHGIPAGRAIFTGLVGAPYLLEDLAVIADEEFRTLALVRSRKINADSVVLTGPSGYTLVNILIAPVIWA